MREEHRAGRMIDGPRRREALDQIDLDQTLTSLSHQIMAFGISATEVLQWHQVGGKYAQRWERGFAALCNFHRRKGHCCPPQRHLERKYNLGSWVIVQRYRKDDLSVERKKVSTG